jgi:hypothetical protein
MHAVVIGFIYAVVYLLKFCFLSTALRSERTFAAYRFAAAVSFLLVAFAVGTYAFVVEDGLLASFFGAFILVFVGMVYKPFPLGFVLSVVGDVGIYVVFFAILQCCAAAVTRIGRDLLYA